MRVLDVGGGNGLEAIAFAAQGHSITLLDFSTEMLSAARHNAEASGVAQRITFYQADLAAIPTLFPDDAFDVILCHDVLQFAEDVGATLFPTMTLSAIPPSPRNWSGWNWRCVTGIPVRKRRIV